MFSFNVPKEYPLESSPLFIKGINKETNNTNGMIINDLLITKLTGILENKVKAITRTPYRPKVTNEFGRVKIIKKMNKNKPIIFTLGSRF
jgi:hypothetical protein